MYDELVKSLRICSRCDFGQDCNGCKQEADDVFCCDKLLHQAADAIEELSLKYIEERNAAVELTGELASKPRWIPVTERLPEHSGFYTIFQVGGSYGQISEIKIAYWDSRNFNGGMTTTHWMPLPEPPEEETDGKTL